MKVAYRIRNDYKVPEVYIDGDRVMIERCYYDYETLKDTPLSGFSHFKAIAFYHDKRYMISFNNNTGEATIDATC
ncbi:hypothetical protein [Lactobacillus selangorensis]|uniref:hypothetical protein n=1 Tax=Lactobacillus selangorensis TaxID=81857 RepID=UPI00070F8861|nr:hypothetical protein [Lactobacillus selangorensis]